MTRRKLHLYGPLKKFAPDGLELEAENVLQAINGMCKVLGLKPNAITGRTQVKVVGFDTVEALSAISDTVDLHIVPAICGGKSQWVQIVVGAVLIAATFAIGMPALSFSLAGGTFSGGAMMLGMGASMVLGGLSQMLFPIKQADQGDNTYAGPPGNTTQIGTRIPLVFGETNVYGQILSYNVDHLET